MSSRRVDNSWKVNGMIVLSFVERGWQAAREWSIHHRPPQTRVIHVVKGSLGADVRAMIRPVSEVSLVAVPRNLFWPVALAMFVWYGWRGRLEAILVDNDRSQRRVHSWVRWRPTRVLRVHEAGAVHADRAHL